ncbi:MAG: hypothetical protein HN576_15835 [Bacteriovoracaceae bacterium]|jgi:hypothetical protein|nr:hypothetical protein [Bacteriovoracaceae bacterium]
MKNTILTLIVLVNTSLAFGAGNKLNCSNIVNLNTHKGQTYLSFMRAIVKPKMNHYATNGYVLRAASDVEKVLENVSSKVKRAAIRSAGNIDNLLNLANELEGQTTNLYELPKIIASVSKSFNRYKLSTFLGLASCGGVIIEYAPGHVAYNIHYGTGENDKDDRTGRSFGEGTSRDADDASDKNYLKDLEEFVIEHKSSTKAFYTTLLKSLSNSDSSDMPLISEHGQTLLTDFLAVYTAEQARNLMDGRISVHWDGALLEVTLLGAFHAGQEDIKLFYKDPYSGETSFTNTVYNQDIGCSVKERKVRGVKLYDYWQFSSSTNMNHCRRSGINITKRSFRKLGLLISDYQRKHNPEIIANVERHFTSRNTGKNVFYQLSKFFINSKTPVNLGDKRASELSLDFTTFLLQVRKDAAKITAEIEKL